MRPRLLLLLVLLAGCSTLTGTPAREELTPAPVPESTTSPAGLDAGVGEDPGLVAERHTDRLRDRSYTVLSNYTLRYRNGSLRSRAVIRVALAADRTYLSRVETAGPRAWRIVGPPPATATFWSNGSLYASRYVRGNETEYSEFRPGTDAVGTWHFWARRAAFRGGARSERQVVAALFDSIETNATTVEPGNGRRTYRLVGTGARSNEFTRPGMDDVRNVRLVALVTEAGLVRSFDLRYEATVDGEPVVVRWRVRYSGVGNTTVGRPDWVARAAR